MFARVTRFEAAQAGLNRAIRQFRDELGPHAAQLPGCQGTYLLVDRASGRGMSLTLWTDESTLRAGEEAAAKLRSDATSKQREAGLTLWAVERYEVVVAEPQKIGEPRQTPTTKSRAGGLSSRIGSTRRSR
jgi:heme-degrading monooxygenase HmoA